MIYLVANLLTSCNKGNKLKARKKWILGGLCLSAVLIIAFLYIFRDQVLSRAGEFMAPRGEYKADIAIVAGASYLERYVAEAGFELLKTGKVKRLAIVLHNINPLGRPYGLNENYPEMVRKEILKRGLKESEFEVLVVRIDHPITLTEARNAIKALARENIKSAILLAPSFHTRRSYLAYQYAANPYQIVIYPQACFSRNGTVKWWTDDSSMRDFSAEAVKLAFYLAAGHIPFKFSY